MPSHGEALGEVGVKPVVQPWMHLEVSEDVVKKHEDVYVVMALNAGTMLLVFSFRSRPNTITVGVEEVPVLQHLDARRCATDMVPRRVAQRPAITASLLARICPRDVVHPALPG